ncbi:hypothetical protein PVAG01_09391 [Phlyctema vagabunda]|uniref:Uncharacterized protein n=1 Tax=Phlyctema vagabunda TaxID=108571 RepID=A0ABR4P777_9HELO
MINPLLHKKAPVNEGDNGVLITVKAKGIETPGVEQTYPVFRLANDKPRYRYLGQYTLQEPGHPIFLEWRDLDVGSQYALVDQIMYSGQYHDVLETGREAKTARGAFNKLVDITTMPVLSMSEDNGRLAFELVNLFSDGDLKLKCQFLVADAYDEQGFLAFREAAEQRPYMFEVVGSSSTKSERQTGQLKRPRNELTN